MAGLRAILVSLAVCSCQSDLAATLNHRDDASVDPEPAVDDDNEVEPEAPGNNCTGPSQTCDPDDQCPDDPMKTEPGVCGCGIEDRDSDQDGELNCAEECPNDPNKTEPGVCGCGVEDGQATTADECQDGCLDDPEKTAPGKCGCGVEDVDTDSDGEPDCSDECSDDPAKISAGECGCGVEDIDTDSDGTFDCDDACPMDAAKTSAGECGCGVEDVDTDSDGTADCSDLCPDDPEKIDDGVCGCGVAEADEDGDDVPDCIDECIGEDAMTDPTLCGCSATNEDSDEDGVADCADDCPEDPNKVLPGVCDCGMPDTDSDADTTADCIDECPDDPNKTEAGVCDCNVADADTDGDGSYDCDESCPTDPDKLEPGTCGCGNVETPDSDADGAPDCLDACPSDPDKETAGTCGCGNPDTLGASNQALCVNLKEAMIHRYSFNGSTSTVTDSVGMAHGVVVGTTLPGNGTVTLSGGTYVDLPNNILSGVINGSIEAWFTRSASGNWQRLFDFGDNNGVVEGEQGDAGISYLFLTPQTSTVLRIGFRPTGGSETAMNAGDAAVIGALEHVVVVLDDAANTMLVYRNGVLSNSMTWSGALSQVNAINNWLGRSQFSADPDFGGSIAEFRIYDAALTAAQVQYSFGAGQEPPFLEP